MWKDEYKGRSYISLTVHFFDGIGIQYRVVKSDEYDEDDKTGVNMLRWFVRTMKELMPNNPNYYLCTDSAPNVVSAFKNSKTRFSCIAHSLHLVVTELVSDLNKSNDKTAEVLSKAIRECKSLATHFNHIKPPQLERTIKNVVATRWNSVLTMLRSIYSQFDNVKDILEDRQDYDYLDCPKEHLKVWIDFLAPIEEISVSLSSSSLPSLNLVVPKLNLLIKNLVVSKDDDSEFQFLKRRFKLAFNLKVLPKMEVIHFAVPLMDFRFKSRSYNWVGCKVDTADGKQLIKQLFDCVNPTETSPTKKRKINDELIDSEPEDSDEENELDLFYSSKISLESFYDDTGNFDLFKCWDRYKTQFPKVYKLATWLLSVPATSVLSEKNFSDSKWMINSRRANLNPQNVNDCLVLKSSYGN